MSRVETTADASTLELLAWVIERTRTYADAMEAWKSHCPKSTVWEDALLAGLVRVVRSSDGQDGSRVVLTELGRATLAGRKRQPTAIV